jgi:PAS domain S-box-containing protein
MSDPASNSLRNPLADVEAHFTQLVAGVVDYPIFLPDPTGIVKTWNAEAARIKGYPKDEIVGRPFTLFYLPEPIASGYPQEELRQAVKHGQFEDEGWRLRKDGFWVNVITALCDENRNVQGYLKITRDLTERKQAAEILRQSEERFHLLVEGVQDYGIFMLDPQGFWANVVITALYDSDNNLLGFAKVTRDMSDRNKVDKLLTADRQKNEFLAMLAHELRNPLAPISGAAQLLKLSSTQDPMVETADLMDRQLKHLVRLVDDLLDVSRIINGKSACKRSLSSWRRSLPMG